MSRNEKSNPIRIPRGPAGMPADHNFDVDDTLFSHGCDISLMNRRIHELRRDVKHMQTAMHMQIAMLVMAMYMLLWIVGWGFGWW